ncbi:MAG: UbiA-like protein EboC [Flavobacteriaceae bacterium]
MNPVILGYAQLARPANLPTAAADILAGVAIAGIIPASVSELPLESGLSLKVLQLVFASIFLYAGGVILNDVFDRKIDKIERPERPIPSGLIPWSSAAIFGFAMLLLGILFAFFTNLKSGMIAVILAASIVLYDAFSKKYDFIGPLNMGVCRGLNLILGMSVLGIIPSALYALIPLVYIFAITMISRGEVHGNNKNHLLWAAVLYILVIFAVLTIVPISLANIYELVPYLLFFSVLIFRPLIRAYRVNSPENIKKAVIGGVLALILLDASLAVGFSSWWYGLLVVLLLPLSIWLSRIFAVT